MIINKKILLSLLGLAFLPAVMQAKYISRKFEEKQSDKNLSFLVTFDKKGVNADFGKGLT